MRKHVQKILSAQADLLSPQAIAGVQKAMDALRETCATGDKKAVRDSMTSLENAANKWLKPYPNAGLRENIEVLLVAVAVAMAIRTFYLQPFKIPTGSMQPTLYGITQEDLRKQPDFKIPNPVARFFEYWVNGVSYFHEVAKSDGELRIGPPQRFVLFNLKQSYSIGGRTETIWFPPDNLFERARLQSGQEIHAGEEFMKLKVISGDHLFVDRVTYNFRKPDRGDIVVFKTEGIRHPQVPQDQFYIKRLVSIGGDKVRIGNDHHLIINGRRLDSSTPHFERLYDFNPTVAPLGVPDDVYPYFGHIFVNRDQNDLTQGFFTDETKEFEVRPNHLLVMGDNTRSSLDSRYWGDFSADNVIGKSFFVYWPIGKPNYKGEERAGRFGWSHR